MYLRRETELDCLFLPRKWGSDPGILPKRRRGVRDRRLKSSIQAGRKEGIWREKTIAI